MLRSRGQCFAYPPPLGLPPWKTARRAQGPTCGAIRGMCPKPARLRAGWPVGAGAVALQLALRAAPRYPGQGMPWRAYASISLVFAARILPLVHFCSPTALFIRARFEGGEVLGGCFAVGVCCVLGAAGVTPLCGYMGRCPIPGCWPGRKWEVILGCNVLHLSNLNRLTDKMGLV